MWNRIKKDFEKCLYYTYLPKKLASLISVVVLQCPQNLNLKSVAVDFKRAISRSNGVSSRLGFLPFRLSWSALLSSELLREERAKFNFTGVILDPVLVLLTFKKLLFFREINIRESASIKSAWIGPCIFLRHFAYLSSPFGELEGSKRLKRLCFSSASLSSLSTSCSLFSRVFKAWLSLCFWNWILNLMINWTASSSHFNSMRHLINL